MTIILMSRRRTDTCDSINYDEENCEKECKNTWAICSSDEDNKVLIDVMKTTRRPRRMVVLVMKRKREVTSGS
jgi:hypothetical protein